ncbi:hypothetical protein [Flavisolibacter tropicus]|uniref:hypothetical protein n=1 Tax=Flavisolibacter tropicus TaxID=1492898 RepID=UPI0011DF7C94|nr:hypothetical protein [Flavisolibacter tropicus]
MIDLLFGKKESILTSEILAREEVTLDKMEYLINSGIIHENNGYVSLDERLSTFFLDFLEIGEISIGFIDDNVQALNENLNYYRQEQNPKYVKKIKNTLQKIISITHREIIKLQKAIDDTYRNEANYSIKMQRLESFKIKRDTIIDLIEETEKIYQESKGLLVSIVDAELSSLLHSLRFSLKSDKDYLIEIQNKILEYINRVREQQVLFQKCQYLKELKNRGELHHQTNFKAVLERENLLLFEKRQVLKPRISLEYLRTDEGSKVLAKVAERLKLQQAKPIQDSLHKTIDLEEAAPEKALKININSLVKKFAESNSNLFEFLVRFPYPEALGTITLEDKLRLFIEIVMDYDDALVINHDFDHYEFINVNGQKQKIGFALVYAKQDVYEPA